MMHRIAGRLIVAALLSAPAWAAGGGGASLPQAPVRPDDAETLQRGAAVFVNYCLGCHSASYMRYGRLAEDIGVSESQIERMLIHTGSGLGEDRESSLLADGMETAMDPDDARAWFSQAAPPDLSLSARLRGPDWLYAYMRGFYRDPARPSGWNNTVLENAAMPHVLSALQGSMQKDASGALVQASPGRLSPERYDALVVDLVSFMVYMGEPSRAKRFKIGYLVMAFLLALLLASYFLYREYWRDIK